MAREIQIFIEYKVRTEKTEQYEKVMNHILSLLPEFGANQIQWFLSTNHSNHYIEMFRVPTEAHYFALKKLRTMKNHQTFGLLDHFVDGGVNSIQYWALKAKY